MKRRNKYGVAPKAERTVDNIVFASKREAKRYSKLRLREKAGEIRDLELQPKYAIHINGLPVKIKSDGYPNGRQVVCKLDFGYIENGEKIIEDSKGMDNPLSRLKRALVEAIYGVTVRLV